MASLDQLHPIITPTGNVSWWPLAPGWWLLLITTTLLIVTLFLLKEKIACYFNGRKNKQQAIQLLQEAFNEHQNSSNKTQYLQQCNAILKRFLSSQQYPASMLSCSGSQWAELLSSHCHFKQGDSQTLNTQQSAAIIKLTRRTR